MSDWLNYKPVGYYEDKEIKEKNGTIRKKWREERIVGLVKSRGFTKLESDCHRSVTYYWDAEKRVMYEIKDMDKPHDIIRLEKPEYDVYIRVAKLNGIY
jgi:hypothetical protein